ncbi:hypothetical protein EVAR_33405_1 [Eumeta japonica]|uniref:Uncharacterized protein n=1 Tax=Eumeta variegata TaxID=151549 RepID=A0A4C1W0Z8_EUMVA|nr:hypothetical protein EVAR_33405_1 [Eumeta japonica]
MTHCRVPPEPSAQAKPRNNREARSALAFVVCIAERACREARSAMHNGVLIFTIMYGGETWSGAFSTVEMRLLSRE